MHLFRRLIIGLVVLALVVPVLVMPAGAQEEALKVLILPVNRAAFLPGTYFDFRVEVHAEAMPEDFAVTVNGEDAAAALGGEWIAESWSIGPEDAPQPVQSVIMRDVVAPAPGEYVVEVVAGGETYTATWTVRTPVTEQQARNVILFIADGGSVATYTAARLVSRGMEEGTYLGELTWDSFEEIGLLHTSGVDSIITDSANSASAYTTGHKTSVNANGVYADSSPSKLDDPRTEKLTYLLQRVRDMSIGVVTTSEVTDATPNAMFGYGRDRSTTSQSSYAAQLLDEGLMPQVIMGGGANYFLPNTVDGSRRSDDRDLFAEMEAAGYTLVFNGTELEAAMGATPERLGGFFHPGNMNTWLDRNVYTDNLGDFADQPNLDEMTVAALQVLGQNENGFFLMVEAASVDKQLHPLDFERGIADAIEMDRAVAAAVEWAAINAPDTLIIVTSDHAHSYDVYGTVDVEAFNAATDDLGRRNAIGIYQAAGFPTYEDNDGDFFPDSWEVDVVLAQGCIPNLWQKE